MLNNSNFLRQAQDRVLSDIQKGIIYEVLQNDYSHPIYVVQMVITIKGELDLFNLYKAYKILSQKHEVFSTKLILDPAQQSYFKDIDPNIIIPCDKFDLSDLNQKEQEDRFKNYLSQDYYKSIQIHDKSLMRVACFIFSKNLYKIVWTRHHVLLDHNSSQLLLYELFEIYQAIQNKENLNLHRVDDILNIEDNETKAKSYWKLNLKNISNSANIPATFKNENIKKSISSITNIVDTKKYLLLSEYVTKNNLTLNAVFEGVWGIVLSKYSNNEHVIFGTVRAFPKNIVNKRIGLFINTLPICLTINPSDSIVNLLKQIRKINVDLRPYIPCSSQKIKSWCQLSPELRLFQSIIDYKPNSTQTLLNQDFKNLKFEIDFNLEIPYPLMLEFKKEEEYLVFKFHYDTSLFSEEYIQALVKFYLEVLDCIINQTAITIDCLPTLSQEDFNKITIWNDTCEEKLKFKNIIQSFSEQVQNNKDATALFYNGLSINYGSLDLKTNQLAHLLIDNKAKSSVVGILLDSPLEIIIAILAILKAGGCYFILDPTFPERHLILLLKNSSAKIVITNNSFIKSFPKLKKENIEILYYADIPWNSLSSESPHMSIQPIDPAYLIYTSGSTGEPKGVIVEHQSTVNMALSCINKFNISEKSRILQIASMNFDVFVAEWSMSLLSGASLYLMDKKIFSPDNIFNNLQNYQITAIILASSILSSLPKNKLPYLKTIAIGGERANEEVISFWKDNAELFNIYGITEATVCSTLSSLNEYPNPSIIGKPFPNTEIYILNKKNHLLPIGVPGEICIAGTGIAKGYLTLNNLTYKKFISKKINGHDLRLYKTGDIGRWLPSGLLEFMGRKDEQIKIRGMRVELGEVENAITNIQGISNAVVLLKNNEKNQELVAFVVLKLDSIDLKEIRIILNKTLPNFMVPGQFYKVDRFPLTSNGKIDKNKLLNEYSFQELEYHPTNNISELENCISIVVEKILNIKNIPKEINFLEMGFNSFSLLQLAADLTQALNKPINIIDIFSYTTIHDLANYLEKI